jgi:hypothetical protein
LKIENKACKRTNLARYGGNIQFLSCFSLLKLRPEGTPSNGTAEGTLQINDAESLCKRITKKPLSAFSCLKKV